MNIIGEREVKTAKKKSIVQEDNIKKLLVRMDQDLYNEIERLAKIEDRSINSQIIHSIKNTVKNSLANKK